MRWITDDMREPGALMASPNLTDLAVISDFDETMKVNLPELEEDPYATFCPQMINEDLQSGSVSISDAVPAPRSDIIQDPCLASHPDLEYDWRLEAPKNFEQVIKIQQALMPAIEDYAAYTKESIPEWKEEDPQTIWLSYDEQHARLQRLAEQVWNKRTGRGDARSWFRLRHSKSEDELPLRNPEAPMARLLLQRTMPIDAPKVLRSQGKHTRRSRSTRPITSTSAAALDLANAAIARFPEASPKSPIVPLVRPVGINDEAMDSANRAADIDNARVLDLYSDMFRIWLLTRAFSRYNRKGVVSMTWEIWCKTVAPTVFAKDLGLRSISKLPRTMRPLYQRRRLDTVTLEEARKGHEVWKAIKQVNSVTAKTCYHAFKPYRGVAQEIMERWQKAQEEKKQQDREEATVVTKQNEPLHEGKTNSFFHWPVTPAVPLEELFVVPTGFTI
ncbi:MAG: hypothetical protein Q9217_000829 [Psora testacea]